VHGVIDLRNAEDRMAAAAEYVLGTLDARDHDAFEVAMAKQPALQSEVYAWQDRLLSLSRHAAPVQPASGVWRRIDDSVRAMAATKPRIVDRESVPRLRWWQRATSWQGISALAIAASLLMAVALVQQGFLSRGGVAQDRYLAVLQSPTDKSTGWIVEIDARRSVRLVPVIQGMAAPAGRSLQFWTKPEGAAAPTSLGLVRAGQAIEWPVSRLPGVGERQLFEITLEPENGSPTGRPTGPILYVGRTVHL
jgi:anti-sigma-K factor RskA